MNNFLRIMSLEEEMMHGIVFASGRNEGGINLIFDPDHAKYSFQVFIHKPLPLSTNDSWEFDNFGAARSFAATLFKQDWEMLTWDRDVHRPCSDGGQECGSGNCEMCKTTGGGCKTCGASD